MSATRELVIVNIDELSPFREATTLRRRVTELLAQFPLEELDLPGPTLELRLWFAATASCSSIAGAMRAKTAREEVHLMRDADCALTELRGYAFDALRFAGWAPEAFDEVAGLIAICLREVLRYEISARRLARHKVDHA